MVQQVIERARRRFILNLAFWEVARAAVFALASVCALLLLGSDFLQPWLVALVALTSIVAGAVRIHRRIPSAYAIAVHLDNTAGLDDVLSTSLHLSTQAATSSEFPNLIQQQAESAARHLQIHKTIPWTLPKQAYGLGALVLIACVLVAMRYRDGHFDLRAPMVQSAFEDYALPQNADASPPKTELASYSAFDSRAAEDAAGQYPAEGGLASQIKTALSNLLSPPSPQGKDAEARERDKPQSGKSDKPESSADQQDPKASPDSQAQPSDSKRDSKDSQNKPNPGQSQQSAKNGGKGGKEEGDKDLRAAEELKALGQLSEIIGKRSATVSGESFVEGQSGAQTLQTGYSASKAQFTAAAVEMDRDEIPMAAQSYVRKYYSAIRKADARLKGAESR